MTIRNGEVVLVKLKPIKVVKLSSNGIFIISLVCPSKVIKTEGCRYLEISIDNTVFTKHFKSFITKSMTTNIRFLAGILC